MATKQFHGETNAERRRYERKPIKLQVSYFCVDKGQISGSKTDLAEDLGAGGLLMRSQQQLPKDQVLMLTLYLPSQEKRQSGTLEGTVPEEDSVAVEILSRVAWSAPDSSGGFMIGVQFLDLDQSNRKWLKDFLVDFKLDQPDSTLYS